MHVFCDKEKIEQTELLKFMITIAIELSVVFKFISEFKLKHVCQIK